MGSDVVEMLDEAAAFYAIRPAVPEEKRTPMLAEIGDRERDRICLLIGSARSEIDRLRSELSSMRQQEPVAWQGRWVGETSASSWSDIGEAAGRTMVEAHKNDNVKFEGRPLYAHPVPSSLEAPTRDELLDELAACRDLATVASGHDDSAAIADPLQVAAHVELALGIPPEHRNVPSSLEVTDEYRRGQRDALNAVLSLNPEAAKQVARWAEKEPDIEGRLPFDVALWASIVAGQLGFDALEGDGIERFRVVSPSRDDVIEMCAKVAEASAKRHGRDAEHEAQLGKFTAANHWNAVRDGCNLAAEDIRSLKSQTGTPND